MYERDAVIREDARQFPDIAGNHVGIGVDQRVEREAEVDAPIGDSGKTRAVGQFETNGIVAAVALATAGDASLRKVNADIVVTVLGEEAGPPAGSRRNLEQQ